MLRTILPALLLLAFVLSGCSSGGDDNDVEVDDDYFEPEETTIDAGTTLHFEVESGAEHGHTITIHKVGDPVTTLLENKTVRAGDALDFTFSQAGTYHVWCRFHGTMTSGMHMLVTVE